MNSLAARRRWWAFRPWLFDIFGALSLIAAVCVAVVVAGHIVEWLK